MRQATWGRRRRSSSSSSSKQPARSTQQSVSTMLTPISSAPVSNQQAGPPPSINTCFHKHLHHGRHFQQLVVPARALLQRKGEATNRRNSSARARASSCDASVHQVGWSREDWMSRLKTSTTVYVDNMSFYTAEEQVHFFFSQVTFDPYYPNPTKLQHRNP